MVACYATQGHWQLSALFTTAKKHQTGAQAHNAALQVLQAWIQPHTPGALAPRELEDASQKKLGPRWRKGDRKYFCGMKPIYWEMERRQRATGMSDAAVMQEMDSEAKSLKPPLGLSPHQYAAAVSKRPDYKAFAEVKWAEYKAFDNTSGSRGSPAKAM